MKKVREYINEKFVEDSDPIKDLGIGMSAVIKKYLQELKNKKQTHADINDDGNQLWVCARFGKYEYVEYLIKKGVDIHKKHDRALRWASKNKDYKMVKLLLDNGADVNAYNSGAMDLAHENHDKKMIQLLKKYGGVDRDPNIDISSDD